MRKVLFLTFLFISEVSSAQFFTLQPYNGNSTGKEDVSSTLEYKVVENNVSDEKPVNKSLKTSKIIRFFKAISSPKKHHSYISANKSEKTSQYLAVDSNDVDDLFPHHDGYVAPIRIEKDIPLFVNATDSLMFGLLGDRMDVCLPLDFLHINSDYGYRTDPITKCRRFHDGIDLRCNHARVYAMLPGVVREVHHGNRGYGNYIILDHGSFQCMYAHLALITAAEGQVVEAGTIVGISGGVGPGSGKSTGPHLHLRLMRVNTNGKIKSLDPEPFLAYLNNYIGNLEDQMAYFRLSSGEDLVLSLENLSQVLRQYKVKFPKIVMAQALLETGYFSSDLCTTRHNLFGLRRPSNGHYYEFDRWEESVKAYRDYVQYKYKGGDYYAFLRDIGYAADPTYTSKLREIAMSL